MRISVIIPVYNRVDGIVPSLLSVLEQTRAADEIIVVDDGSTDDISKALDPFLDRVRLIRQENGGVASARNIAASAATGDWLTFQDSDDLWVSTHLENTVRDLEICDAEIVCHIGDVVYTGADYSKRLFEIKNLSFPSGTAEKLQDPLSLVISGMTLQGAAVRRDVFLNMGGFDTEMRMLSDTAFFCQLALEGPFLVTGDLMAEIRRLPGDEDSITSLHRKNALYARQMHVRILDRMLPRLLTKEQKVLVNRLLSGAEFRLAEVVSRSSPSNARKLLWRSAMRHPQPLVGLAKAMMAIILGRAGYRFVLYRHRMLDRG